MKTIISIMKIFVLLVSVFVTSCVEPPLLITKGHHTIGVLMEMRSGGTSGNCKGTIEPWILQEVATLEWALTTISNQTKDSSSIGLAIYDSCGNTDRVIRQATQLATENDGSPLIGIISAGPIPETNVVASYLHAFSIPLISTRNPDRRVLKMVDNLFTTAPHLHAQMQAVISLIKKYDLYRARLVSSYKKINVISESSQALSSLSRLAAENELEIRSLLLDPALADDKVVDKVKHFVKSEQEFQGVVVSLLGSKTVNLLARKMDRYNIVQNKYLWIFAIVDGEPSQHDLDAQEIMLTFGSASIVEPHSPMLPGLEQFLKDSLTTNKSMVHPLLPLLPRTSICNQKEFDNKSCSVNHTLSGTRATSIVKAVSSLVAAFRLVQILHCQKDLHCTNNLPSDISRETVNSLKKLSYKVQGSADNIRYTVDGRFMTTFVISRVSMSGLRQIGRYREDTNLLWMAPKKREESIYSTLQNVQTTNLDLDLEVDNETRYQIDFLYYPSLFSESRAISGVTVTIVTLVGIWVLVVFFKVIRHHYHEGNVPVYFYILDSGMCLIVLCTYAVAMFCILPPSYTTCKVRERYVWFCVAMCYVVLATHVFLKRSLLMKKVAYKDFYMTMGLTLISAFALGNCLSRRYQHEDDPPLFDIIETNTLICYKNLLEDFLVPTFFPSWILFCFTVNAANQKADPNCPEASRLCKLFVLHFVLFTGWICSHFRTPATIFPLVTGCVLIVFVTSIVVINYLPQTKCKTHESTESRGKRPSTNSISMVVSHLDGPQALRPPAPFCDPPKDRSRQELPMMRPWRMDFQESPILRYSIPPPPPPPLSCQRLYDTIPTCHQYATYP